MRIIVDALVNKKVIINVDGEVAIEGKLLPREPAADWVEVEVVKPNKRVYYIPLDNILFLSVRA
jgi:hypothetical protein